MIGPECCWHAADVPTIFIRAAYRTTNTTAQLLWETTEKPGFHPERLSSNVFSACQAA